MGTLDMIMSDAESRFGLSQGKASSLLSSLLALINEQRGGLSDLLDRFKRVGLGDTVSSWLHGDAKAVGGEQLESALGRNTIEGIASKAGLSLSAASAALGFMLPKVIQKLAPSGVPPSHLPSEFSSYMTGPTAAVASGARQAVYVTERAAEKTGASRFLWPLLGLLALFLLGFWMWNRGGSARTAVSNAKDRVQLAAKALRRYPAVEELNRQTLEVQRRVLGPEHPDTLNSAVSLAAIFRKEGRYVEAENLTRASLASQRKVLGDSHPSCAFSIYNLGVIAALQGKRDEAFTLLHDALDHQLAPDTASGIETDPELKSLHGDPRFDALVVEAQKRAIASARSTPLVGI